MFYVEVNAAENGSVLRVVAEKTGKCICIGGFEGLQRYMRRHKIKSSRIAGVCAATEWEVFGYISIGLTEAMVDGKVQDEKRYIGDRKAGEGVKAVARAISTHTVGGVEGISEDSGVIEGVCVGYTRSRGFGVFTLELPESRGGFDRARAEAEGITKQSDWVQLVKEGRVAVGGRVFTREEFLGSSIVFPYVVVITLVDESVEAEAVVRSIEDLAKREDVEKRGGAMDIYVRTSFGGFSGREKKYQVQGEVCRAVEAYGAGCKEKLVPGRKRVFSVVDSESEVEAVETFYTHVSKADKRVLHPTVFRVEKYLEHLGGIPKVHILQDRSIIRYGKDKRSGSEDRDRWENAGAKTCGEHQSVPETVGLPGSLSTASPYCVFLGTSGAVPSATRNVSSILSTTYKGGILLDCGENTAAQLNKVSAGYTYAFDDLNMVLLTHRHADHILGVFSVLKEANCAGNITVVVVGETALKDALDHYGLACVFIEVEETLKIIRACAPFGNCASVERIYVHSGVSRACIEICKHVRAKGSAGSLANVSLDPYNYVSGTPRNIERTEISVIKDDLGLVHLLGRAGEVCMPQRVAGWPEGGPSEECPERTEISFVHALHITNSYGIKVTEFFGGSPFVITYSGDTLPNLKFAEFSHKADIMIHEGTFEECDREYAAETQHSTISDATNIFRASQAKHLIITHISQRYKTVNVLWGYLAVDYMVFSVDRLYPQDALLRELQRLAE